MPSAAMLLDVDTLLQVAQSLENVVSRCFGPEGGQVLFCKATGDILITRDGKTILESLLLDHPIARMIVECAAVHYSLTGDGVKTFVMLLCSILRGLRAIVDKHDPPVCGTSAETAKHQRHRHILKKIAHSLSMFQACILDPIITHDVAKHLLSVYSLSAGKIQLCKNALRSTLEVYFYGRIENINHKFLAKLALDYFCQCLACENSESEMVSLVDDLYSDLHTEVSGLPVGSSRILTGLVLHRDFAVYCPAEGERRVLLVTEPIHPVLSIPDSEFIVKFEAQLQVSQVWMAKQTETIMKHLQNNHVKVLLSSVKQPEIVLHYAKQSSISVVDCLLAEQMSLLCRISGLSPACGFISEILCAQEVPGTAVLTFCQPVVLGSRRFVHLGLRKTRVFDPHCVVVCGPLKGLTQQYVSAFHGAFKMLRQLFKAADVSIEHGNKPVEQTQGPESSFCTGNVQKQNCSDTRLQCTCVDSPVREEVKNSLNAANPVCTANSLEMPLSCRNGSENDQEKRSESVQGNCSIFAAVMEGKSTDFKLELLSRERVKQYTTGDGAMQRPSMSFIEAGAVLPVGGTFEMLLHYYLSCRSQQCHKSEMITVSTLVADALLGIPKSIYQSKKGNMSFPQVYTRVVNAIRRNEPKQDKQNGLESVSCKHQLLASVLQCVTKLVIIDMLIGVSRGPSRNTEADSDSEF